MLNPLFLKENNFVITRIEIVLFFLCVFIISHNSRAAGKDMSFAAIPKQLLENAKAVVRYKESTFEIKSAGKAVLKVSFALTVVNENGVENGYFAEFYDPFSRIGNIRGTVYDSNGKKVEKIGQDDILDVSAISGFSVYEDNRVKLIQPKYRTFPFTVEYSYEIVYNGIMDYPDFYLVDDYEIAVEEAGFMVIAPDSADIRYVERNLSSSCKVEKTEGGKTYFWKFSQYLPIRKELFCQSVSESVPSVLLSPCSFKIKDVSAKINNWQDYGTWIYDLNKGRDELSQETKTKIGDLIAGIKDTIRIIDTLYKYLQDKTRYVNIKVGLGGWQPFKADVVDRLSYGDCKALTNYMQSLLKVAGISSIYTLAKAGNNKSDILTEFPSNQFNHAFLCVPLSHDTVWLECTSQHIPPGYLGSFTDDRHVLLITENGGKLARTPVYNQNKNVQCRISNILLDRDGNGEVRLNASYGGIYYDEMLDTYLSDETDKRKKIEESIEAGNFTLQKYDLVENRAGMPKIREQLDLTIRKVGVRAGGLVLFAPNLFSRQQPLPSQIHQRNCPVIIGHSTCKIDTIWYSLPEGLTCIGRSIHEVISSRFGFYQAETNFLEGKIRYVRNFTLYKGSYNSELYGELCDFYDKVSVADNKKLTLKELN